MRSTSAPADYPGLPADFFAFLDELAANNSKPWFAEHRERYRASVQEPAMALVAALGSAVAAEFPGISYDTRANGGSLMRIYRDVRFSADKSPFKTNVAMMFVGPGRKKMESPGYGLQLSSKGVELVAGVFGFQKEALQRYRDAVLGVKSGGELEAAAATVPADTGYTWSRQTYKQVPRGLPADHRRAEWLRYTGLAVYSPVLPKALSLGPAFIPEVMKHFRAMSPVERWLSRYVYG